MSPEYSLIDCTMAPLLWRLPSLGIDINSLSPAIVSYANRLFSREAFQLSLSEKEKEMVPRSK
jgi:RNA polymerase-associated protein